MINTICVALTRSIIDNAQKLEFKTYLAGQVYGNKGFLLILLTFKILMYFSRGAAIFSVVELIVLMMRNNDVCHGTLVYNNYSFLKIGT